MKAPLITLVLLMTPVAASAEEFWQFGVYLGEKRIGEHRFELVSDGDIERVRSVAQFTARILFVPVYKYEHVAEELWSGGCLQSIRSSSRANGKRFVVTGQREDDHLVVDTVINGQTQSQTLDGCVRAYAYWDQDRLDTARVLLNPQTGDLEAAELVNLGDRQRLITKAGEIDLWYSSDGHWLGLRADTPAGKPLIYRLEDSHRWVAAMGSESSARALRSGS